MLPSEHLLPKKQPPAKFQVSSTSGLEDFVMMQSLFHTDTQLIPKPSHSLSEDIIDSKNIYCEHESNETLNAVTFPKKYSQSIHVPGKRSVSKDNKNDLLEVPNYEKCKIEEPSNNVKPLNERDSVQMVKLDRSENAENRPKEKLMVGTLKRNETRRKDQLDLLISARAESAHNVSERHFANEPGFEFHHHLHSFETGDLVLYDWPKQCDRKLTPMFKGPLMIVRPVGAVYYVIKSKESGKKLVSRSQTSSSIP
ncbi:hypothetical protein AVEN_96268-1 [Araneus ventricosus]|uniref:Uncharacterized protein n=1 Tax=Araneus ventricosus TaxID=182803 RepID=A0A4Y2H1B0_ARAVE|nr:hypothetical protein AVEN_96268-1 [Araneus ventricosus]